MHPGCLASRKSRRNCGRAQVVIIIFAKSLIVIFWTHYEISLRSHHPLPLVSLLSGRGHGQSLSNATRVTSWPVWLFNGRIVRFLLRTLDFLWKALEALCRFAREMPILSIPLTVTGCGLLLYVPSVEHLVPGLLSSLFQLLVSTVTRFYSTPATELLSDSVLALVWVTWVQILAHYCSHRLLTTRTARSNQRAAVQPQQRSDVVVLQQEWNDACLVIRASAKALVLPMLVLHGSAALGFSATTSGLAALSYLLPWAMENGALYGTRSTIPMISPQRRRQDPVRPVDGVDGMEVLRANAPADGAVLFLAAKDGCCLCLEEWSSDVLQAHSVAALQNVHCTALRCGHVLHRSCAEQFIKSNYDATRHPRCPLCRQPVTLSGEVSAGLFS